MTSTAEQPERSGVLTALKYRNYRVFWYGNLLSLTADWQEQVALNWLIISTTGDPVMLGIVNLCRGIPIMVFSVVGGALTDMFDRRRYLMATQVSAAIVSLLLAITVWNGAEAIWLIVFLATCRGIATAFNLPGRHSIIYELIPRKDVASGVALNSVTINMAKILGPLLAAFVIATIGNAACFAINAVAFSVVVFNLTRLNLPPKPVRESRHVPVLKNMMQGFRYIRHEPTLLLLVMVGIIPTFFCQPYLTMLALFAADVFHAGPEGLGILTATAAGGAICGGLLAARVQANGRSGKIMLAFLTCFPLAIIAFAAAPTFAIALPFIFCVGAMHIAYNSSNMTILQLKVEDDYRGRVTSTLIMTRGLMSVGTATMAGLAALVGARVAMTSMALVVVVFAAALWLFAPRLRNLRA